jgi:hypothetical protein
MKDHRVADQFIIAVSEFSREEAGSFQPGQEEQIAFPKEEVWQLVVIHPLQVTFGGIDQLPFKVIDDEHKSIPIFVIRKAWKGQETLQDWVAGNQT